MWELGSVLLCKHGYLGKASICFPVTTYSREKDQMIVRLDVFGRESELPTYTHRSRSS